MNNKQNGEDVTSKQVFTTGETAKICNVSQQTIIRCFDSGRLSGFKVPGSRFRRIPRPELVRFMQQNGMNMNRFGQGYTQVLVIGLSAANVDSVIKTHSVGHAVKITHAEDAWSAGFMSKECQPSLILINPTVEGINKQAIIECLVSNGSNKPLIVEVENNSHNELNVQHHTTDSKEAIRLAVQELLSA